MSGTDAAQRVREIHDIAARAMAKGAPTRARPALLRELAGLADDAPSVQWQEAYAMLLVLGRQKPGLARRLLDRVRLRRQAEGEATAHVAFEARINAYLAPASLTPHGYTETFQTRDGAEIWARFARLADRLQGLGLRFFLNSGTLLGMVRDGALIGHDDDIDLAVILNVKRREDVAAAWEVLRTRLETAGLLAEAVPDMPGVIKLRSDIGVDVDLFPAWLVGDAGFVYPHTNGELSRRDILPLGRCAISGQPLPANPEAMLAQNYGAGWRDPDPHFRFPWAQQDRLFADVFGDADQKAA